MGKHGRKIISALLMAVMLMGVAAIPAALTARKS